MRNKPVRTRIKTASKKALGLMVSGAPDEAREAVHDVVQVIDRAAAKGVIHRNAAARRKSRLMRRFHQTELPSP